VNLSLFLFLALFQISTLGSKPRTLILLSLDGFRHDYPERTKTPALDQMEREGGRIKRLIPVYPSQTFPAHASLATGVSAGRHGIINNLFRDRKRGIYKHSNQASWYEVPPLWIYATQQGRRAHVYHWIGSEGAWKGSEPTFWRAYDPKVKDEEKLESILGWLRGAEAERPELIMAYLNGCDRSGHHFGPHSPEVIACIQHNDQLLGGLLKGLKEIRERWPLALFVVSDHGMTETRGTLNPWRALEGAPFEFDLQATGPVAHLYLKNQKGSIKAVRALAAKLPHSKIYSQEELPTAWGYQHNLRTGDLVWVADFGWRFDAKAPGLYSQEEVSGYRGHHGHAPEIPDMGALLYAWGDGIRAGAQLKRARAVDLFPSLCQLMRIPSPKGLEGRVLKGLLAP